MSKIGTISQLSPVEPYVRDSDHLKILGDRVRQARTRRGMIRKLLARDSGVSERYLAQLESGQGNVSILLLHRIARALDVPLEALVLEGPEPPVDLVHTVEFCGAYPWRTSSKRTSFCCAILAELIAPRGTTVSP